MDLQVGWVVGVSDQRDDSTERRPGETDAEARLRWHEDPENPFALGPVSLAEVREAVANGWPEARARDYTDDELVAMHDDPGHPLTLPADQLAQAKGEQPQTDADRIADLEARLARLEADRG